MFSVSKSKLNNIDGLDRKSESGSDITMTQSRESMLAEAEAAKIKGEASTLDFEHCFTLAAPKEKDRKYEH